MIYAVRLHLCSKRKKIDDEKQHTQTTVTEKINLPEGLGQMKGKKRHKEKSFRVGKPCYISNNNVFNLDLKRDISATLLSCNGREFHSLIIKVVSRFSLLRLPSMENVWSSLLPLTSLSVMFDVDTNLVMSSRKNVGV